MDRETVDRARREADNAFKRLQVLKPLYEAASRDYLKKSKVFRDLDYQLALEDGRLKKIPSLRERKEKKQPELTLEQLRTIAALVGVDITIE